MISRLLGARAGSLIGLALLALALSRFPAGAPSLPERRVALSGEALLHGLPDGGGFHDMPLELSSSALLMGHASPRTRALLPRVLWDASLVLAFAAGTLTASPLAGGLAALLTADALWPSARLSGLLVPAVLLLCGALAWARRKDTPAAWALAGLCLGMTFLLRSTLVLLPPAGALWLWASGRRRSAVFFLAGAYAPLLPWLRLNALSSGQWALFEAGRADFNIVSGALGHVSTLEGDQRLLASVEGSPVVWALREAARHPVRYLGACGARLGLVVSWHPWLALLAAASAWRAPRAWAGPALLAACYAAAHLLMPVKPEYFQALWPVLAVLAGAGLARPFGEDERGRAAGTAVLAAAFALLAGFSVHSLAAAAAYPSRAAQAGRLESLASAPGAPSCLRAALGRRLLAEGRAQAALPLLEAAWRGSGGVDALFDRWQAALAAGEDFVFDEASLAGGDAVRASALRALAALQAGRSPAAHLAELDERWRARYRLALDSSWESDRQAQRRLERGDPGMEKLFEELLAPWPPERADAVVVRLRAAGPPASMASIGGPDWRRRRERERAERRARASGGPAEADALQRQALELSARGRLDEALAALDRLLLVYPRHARALSDRAVLHARQGHLAQAEVDLERAIAAEPRLLQARLSLGVLYSATGRGARAERTFAKALAVPDPIDGPAVRPMLAQARARLRAGRPR